MSEKIGDMLIKNGMLSQAQLMRALREQKKSPGERLGHTLVRIGYIGRREMVEFLNDQKKASKKKSWIEKLLASFK
jgi:lipid II:glycine glycyltransferase (peptidoglycan interpeptide bridge formation enzyme)